MTIVFILIVLMKIEREETVEKYSIINEGKVENLSIIIELTISYWYVRFDQIRVINRTKVILYISRVKYSDHPSVFP